MSTQRRLNVAARGEYRRLRRAADMPVVTHAAVRRDCDIPVQADDGVVLLTDHWHADGAGAHTLLIRTPYGRDDIAGVARFIAERGHHVVVQSCRGTFGSGGDFFPLRDEVADGQATMRWLRAQPWATGLVHSWGGSYFGATQWAYCDGDLRPDAMGIAVSARRFDEAILYPGGGFDIDTPLTWAFALGIQERPFLRRLRALLTARTALRRGASTIPPADAVLRAPGEDPPFFRSWVEHSDEGDPWWRPMHFASDLATIPPVTLVAGWQDLFLDAQLRDHAALVAAGVPVRLLVGDWIHGASETTVIGVREALRSFAGTAATSGARVQVTGVGEWIDLDAWPPASAARDWELSSDGALTPGRGSATPGSLPYRYDPADPTPDAGGRTLNPFGAGRRRQRLRERRDDVLVFTGNPLQEDLTVMGVPSITLTLSSTNPRVDVFVRLCEVDEKGVSRTLTDRYRRLPAASETHRTVSLDLAPIAHRFARGTRLRVQVSSGAHPLHLRNPGTADPVRDHSRLVPSDQILHLGSPTPAVLTLPITG